jgi:hypothetical protein
MQHVILFIMLGVANAAAQGPSAERMEIRNPETLIEARDVDPRDTARDDPRLLRAQALIAEGGWTLSSDHLAIVGVIRNRATLPAFRDLDNAENAVLLRFVSAFKCGVPDERGRLPTCDSERRRRMRSISWALVESHAPAIARVAEIWTKGDRIPDPCLGAAWDWGSVEDSHGDLRERVACGDFFLRQEDARRIASILGVDVPRYRPARRNIFTVYHRERRVPFRGVPIRRDGAPIPASVAMGRATRTQR